MVVFFITDLSVKKLRDKHRPCVLPTRGGEHN